MKNICSIFRTQAVAEFLNRRFKLSFAGEKRAIDAVIRSAQRPEGRNIVILGDAAIVETAAVKDEAVGPIEHDESDIWFEQELEVVRGGQEARLGDRARDRSLDPHRQRGVSPPRAELTMMPMGTTISWGKRLLPPYPGSDRQFLPIDQCRARGDKVASSVNFRTSNVVFAEW